MSERSDRIEAARLAFDAAARRYAEQFADELDRKPFDRALLERFATTVRRDGRVLDIGTGPAGHIGRELARRGLRVTGVDISAESIAYARSIVPDSEMDFVVADARALPFEDGSIAMYVAFYSLIYGTDDDVLASLREARRVLEPGGRFLAAVHGGTGEEHTDDFLGTALEVTVRLTSPAGFATLVERAGLRVDQLTARAPYETEFKTTRIYLEGSAPA